MITGSVLLNLWKHSKMSEDYWRGPKRISCDACNGRGWHRQPSDALDNWCTKCTLCNGKGDVSLRFVARLINEDPGVLYRLSEQRIRPKTAQRILPKLAALCSGQVGGLIDASR